MSDNPEQQETLPPAPAPAAVPAPAALPVTPPAAKPATPPAQPQGPKQLHYMPGNEYVCLITLLNKVCDRIDALGVKFDSVSTKLDMLIPIANKLDAIHNHSVTRTEILEDILKEKQDNG